MATLGLPRRDPMARVPDYSTETTPTKPVHRHTPVRRATARHRPAHKHTTSEDRAAHRIAGAVKKRAAGTGREAFAEAVREVFQEMDRNHDGYLSKKEIRAALVDLGDAGALLHPDDLEDIFRAMDLHGHGRVSYDELAEFLADHVHGAPTLDVPPPLL